MTAPIWRGVARRLGEWHAVLPIGAAVESMPTKDTTIACQLDIDTENKAKPTDDLSPVKPRRSGPNLWTVIQKWILALPVATEDQRTRRLNLQKELEWVVRELDDGQGLGEEGVRTILALFAVAGLINSLAGICPL